MSVTGGAVLFIVVWFLTMFITLQVTTRSQGDTGTVVPGTHEGAPADFRLGRTILIVTVIATLIWGALAATILSGVISVEDLDWLDVLEDRTPN